MSEVLRRTAVCLLALLPLAGCEMVTKKEFAVHTRQLNSMQSDIRSTNSRVETNASGIRRAHEGLEALQSRMSQEDARLAKSIQDVAQVSRDEDQRLRLAVSDETKERKTGDAKLGEAIAQAGAGRERFRRVLQAYLQAERELLVSLVEIEQTIQDLKKKGTLTEKDIQASKAVRLEADVWAKRLESIKSQLDALDRPETTTGSSDNR